MLNNRSSPEDNDLVIETRVEHEAIYLEILP